MKRLLLLFAFISAMSTVKASDTLTFRQVYNFNVGDTFDYSYTLTSNGTGPFYGSFYGDSFQRVMITSKDFSVDSSSVTYVRIQLYPPTYIRDTVTYSNLDSAVTTYFGSVHLNFQSDTILGRQVNKLEYSNFVSYEAEFGQGLGVVNALTGGYYFGCSNGTDHSFGSYHSTLVYYTDGSFRFGQPYYMLNGESLIHYIPIPEDCAYWNYTQYLQNGTDQFQLRTGNKVYLNNHTYVELILRSVVSNIFSGDSLCGYFRNDTSAHKVYFCHQPGINESLMYDFTGIDYGRYDGVYYVGTMVDTFSRGNVVRTSWTTSILEPLGDGCISRLISGIGSEFDLFHSPVCNSFSTCHQAFTSPPVLESFCVCGQILYPAYASATSQCYLMTGINDVGDSQVHIHIYPTPITDLIHLSFPDAGRYSAHLILTDLLGREVYSSPISGTETTHDISKLPTGIYTWRLISDNAILKTGKVVKQ